ncbi:hypothetical protein BH23THE1_BH23THE1_14480 [soil metagenome]
MDINPDDTLALALKGDALYNLGVYDGADAYHNKALASNTFSSSSSIPDEVQILESNLTTSIIPGAKAIGEEKAIINIVEFGDYQCPFCARFNQETKDELVPL